MDVTPSSRGPIVGHYGSLQNPNSKSHLRSLPPHFISKVSSHQSSQQPNNPNPFPLDVDTYIYISSEQVFSPDEQCLRHDGPRTLVWVYGRITLSDDPTPRSFDRIETRRPHKRVVKYKWYHYIIHFESSNSLQFYFESK